MRCELSNVKVNQRLSEETWCFSAVLVIDGVPAADVGNRGTGGPNEIRFFARAVQQKFEAFCKSLPPEKSEHFPEGLAVDAELYVSLLLENHLEQKELAKLCRKKTLFRFTDRAYDRGQYEVVDIVYSTAVKQRLVERLGDRLGEIVNERFAS